MHFTCQESRTHSKVDVIKVFCSFLQIQQETFRLPLNLINILKLEPTATVSCGSLYPSSRQIGLVARKSQDVFEFMLIGMSMTRGIQCMNYVEKHLIYFHILVHVSRKKVFFVSENIQQFQYIYVTSHKFSNKEATMLCVLFSDCELNFVKAKSCCIMYIRNLYQ